MLEEGGAELGGGGAVFLGLWVAAGGGDGVGEGGGLVQGAGGEGGLEAGGVREQLAHQRAQGLGGVVIVGAGAVALMAPRRVMGRWSVGLVVRGLVGVVPVVCSALMSSAVIGGVMVRRAMVGGRMVLAHEEAGAEDSGDGHQVEEPPAGAEEVERLGELHGGSWAGASRGAGGFRGRGWVRRRRRGLGRGRRRARPRPGPGWGGPLAR